MQSFLVAMSGYRAALEAAEQGLGHRSLIFLKYKSFCLDEL